MPDFSGSRLEAFDDEVYLLLACRTCKPKTPGYKLYSHFPESRPYLMITMHKRATEVHRFTHPGQGLESLGYFFDIEIQSSFIRYTLQCVKCHKPVLFTEDLAELRTAYILGGYVGVQQIVDKYRKQLRKEKQGSRV